MTDDQSDPEECWPSMAEAAATIGLSELGFWRLARAESFQIRRQGQHARVLWADVEAYLVRSRPQPPPPPDAGPAVPET